MHAELLAPAGDWDCLKAAVENGADAVYFGLESGFNARARATNFSIDDLPNIFAFLHQRQVKGYVTLNTLVFSEELATFEETIRAIAHAKGDAVLLQDIGAAILAHAIAPDLELHASTQMTLTSGECITAASELGLSRIVLPRELSIEEIRDVHQTSNTPLEAFVHGALCVAYSGQCLTSESLGGRSANRGQCAQACRMPYDLICDEKDVDLGNIRYLLSPQDLAGFEQVPAMLAAGVISFKIEGRLKSAEYVANTTRQYRLAIDQALAGQPVQLAPQQLYELQLSFSRGLAPGWLEGNNHKRLVPGDSSTKRGAFLGDVVKSTGSLVLVRLAAPLSRGDGIVFEGFREGAEPPVAGSIPPEQGGRVFEVSIFGNPIDAGQPGQVVELAFAHNSLNHEHIYPGLKVWKTDDPRLTQRLRETFQSADPIRRVPIDVTVIARTGQPLQLSATLSQPTTQIVTVTDQASLEPARNRPATVPWLQAELDRFGASVYRPNSITAEVAGDPMVPLSRLSALRRDLIAALDARLTTGPTGTIAAEAVLPRLRSQLQARYSALQANTTQLVSLCRTLPQLEALLTEEVSQIACDFADIRQYRTAAELGRAAGKSILLATPRIQKPGEMGLFRAMAKHQAAGYLVRNLAALDFFVSEAASTGQSPLIVADFSLNVANEFSADWLWQRGAHLITPSFDLNRDQLLALVQQVPPHLLEVVIHQHMPMFHMEHCVFCAVLSPGTNKTNCGRPCDVHVVKLRDRVGQEHLLTADVGCRNTLFNAQPQSSAEIVSLLKQQQVGRLRVEFLDESPSQIRQTLALYRDLLDGKTTGSHVWNALQAANRVGVTRGTLEERRNPLAIL